MFSSPCSFIHVGIFSPRPSSRTCQCSRPRILSAISSPHKSENDSSQKTDSDRPFLISPILSPIVAASKKGNSVTAEEIEALKSELETNLENERFEHAVRVFGKLGSANQSARPRIIITYEDMHRVVTRCAEFGDTDLTLKALEIMEQQLRFVRRSTYAIVTRALASSSRPELAYTMIHQLFIRAARSPQREARFFRPDIKMILTTATGAVKNGRLDLTRKLFDLMAKHGLRPNVQLYTIVIEGYGRSSNIGMVDEMVQRLKKENVQPDDLLHGAIMKAYAHCGHLDVACNYFRSILSPTVQQYNALLHSLVSNDHIAKADELYKELMASENIQPTTVTRNIRINCLVKEKHFAQAIDLLPGNDFENRNNIIAYTTVIAALADAGNFSKARELLNQLERNVVSKADPLVMKHLAIAFSALISHLIKAERLQEGWNVYRYMLTHGVEPIFDTYCGIISGLCQTGDEKLLKLAERVFNRMHQKIEHLGLEYQAESVEGGGDESERQNVDMTQARPLYFVRPKQWGNRRLISVYNAMLSGYAHANMMRKSELLFKSMKENGPTPDPITYSTMITGYKLLGDFESCKAKFAELQKAGIRPAVGTMNNFIDACVKEHEVELATEILEDMKSATDTKMAPDRVTYRYIIEALCEEGDANRSFEYYTQMKAAGFLPTESLLVTMMRLFVGRPPNNSFEGSVGKGSPTLQATSNRESVAILLNDMKHAGVRQKVLDMWNSVAR